MHGPQGVDTITTDGTNHIVFVKRRAGMHGNDLHSVANLWLRITPRNIDLAVFF